MSSTSHTTETEPQTTRPAKKYSTADLLYSAAGLFALGIMFFLQINEFESGADENVSIWAPVAALYTHFGYWPAVLLMPSLSMFALWKAIESYQQEHSG